MILTLSIPACASSYKTVTSVKTQYGSSYVWRSTNTCFYVKYSGTTKTISKPVYTLYGVTNGSFLYYSALKSKFAGEVTLYKYNIKSGKEKVIATLKKSLHIHGLYKNCIYGNGANSKGRPSHTVYKYNLKTKKISEELKIFWIEKSNGKYLYGTSINDGKNIGIMFRQKSWKSIIGNVRDVRETMHFLIAAHTSL